MYYDDGHLAWLGRQTQHIQGTNDTPFHKQEKGALMFEQTGFDATDTQISLSTATRTTTSGLSADTFNDTASPTAQTPARKPVDASKGDTVTLDPANVPTYPYDAPIFVDDEETESETESLLLPNGRPKPSAVRGRCPECGEDLVSNLYYIGGQGYLMVWECWGSLGENAECSYRRVL